MRAEKLSELKAFLAKPRLEEETSRIPLGHAMIDHCLKGGLEQGSLNEVFAGAGHEAAATGFVMGLSVRAAAGKRVLWICREFSAHEFGGLSATGLLELGVNPEHMLLFQAANMEESLRAASDALSCAALGAVIIEIPGNPKALDLVASRRLTLAAAQKSITVFLLRLSARPEASSAETRWQVRAGASDHAWGKAPLSPSDSSPNKLGERINLRPPSALLGEVPNGRRGPFAAESKIENWGHPIFKVDLIRNRHGGLGSWAVEWNCDAYCFQTPAQDYSPMVSAPAH
jgi:protein ImuA